MHADVSISKHRALTQIHSLPEVDQIRGFILYVCWGDNFLTEPANELNLVISEESLSNVLLLLAFPWWYLHRILCIHFRSTTGLSYALFKTLLTSQTFFMESEATITWTAVQVTDADCLIVCQLVLAKFSWLYCDPATCIPWEPRKNVDVVKNKRHNILRTCLSISLFSSDIQWVIFFIPGMFPALQSWICSN